MTELELLVDFHKDAQRQGPGSDSDTLKALGFMELETNKCYKIADIGCGSGAQSLALAKAIDAQITAIDLFPEFLEKLRQHSKEQVLDKKIETLENAMENLPFDKETFDIIWSEGAIYNMGFGNGIKKWKEFVKVGGYIAVSEITWLSNKRPPEIENHWHKEYPEIDTASNKMKLLEENGLSPVGYFILPQSSWIDNYYKPMEARFDDFLKKHDNSEGAKSIVKTEKEEIRTYNTYKTYFSYGFYIAKKI